MAKLTVFDRAITAAGFSRGVSPNDTQQQKLGHVDGPLAWFSVSMKGNRLLSFDACQVLRWSSLPA
jgi:hypothetical protein